MAEVANPWVSRSAEEPATTVTAPQPIAAPSGPESPQSGVPAPDIADQLPMIDQPRPAELWCVGAHGGAGESSLADLDPGWAPAGHAWPRVIGQMEPARVLLVARSNVRGLQAAQAAAIQWGSGAVSNVDVLGLAILADARGKLPKSIRDLMQVVGGGVPRVWQVPWIEAWRVGDPLTLAEAPRQLRKLTKELKIISQSGAESTG